jgi:hypothetical protein
MPPPAPCSRRHIARDAHRAGFGFDADAAGAAVGSVAAGSQFDIALGFEHDLPAESRVRVGPDVAAVLRDSENLDTPPSAISCRDSARCRSARTSTETFHVKAAG